METETLPPQQEGILEIFQRLEERTRLLSRNYQQIAEDRERLLRQNREQEQQIDELRSRLQKQDELLAQVDERVEKLLQQIDMCLMPPGENEEERTPDNQVLPGMNDG